jgi:hypothetical protein
MLTFALGTVNETCSIVLCVNLSALMISTFLTSFLCLGKKAQPACSVPVSKFGNLENGLE